MSFDALRPRLSSGRPLVIDADTCASFRARGVTVDTPGAVGELLRRAPHTVRDHYGAEVDSDVNVLCALTADTTPRALAEVGMQHRSAALTGLAIELALETCADSRRPIAVAGLLGSELIAPMAVDRLSDELTEHAERIAHAGAELIIARGLGSRVELMAAVKAGASTQLPVWAVVECGSDGELAGGEPMAPLLGGLTEAGAGAVLFEVASVDDALALFQRHQQALSESPLVRGVLLAASAQSVRGFPEPLSEARSWAARALELDHKGARLIGGGAGTTEAHTKALVSALRVRHPTIPPSANAG